MSLLAVLIIVCGALAASALIIKQKPNAKELLDKLVPFQGGMGAVLVLLSVWAVIDFFRARSALATLSSFGVATGKYTFAIWAEIACGLVGIGLGFLLAYGLFSKYALSKNAVAAEKGAALQARLVGIQIPLGAAGAVCGALLLVARIMI